MAHFARLDDNNIVTRVEVVNNTVLLDAAGPENETLGIQFLQGLYGPGRWKQTSYNGTFRKNYAGIGFLYDGVRDAFIPPRPYASWTLDENTCQWQSPEPYPQDGQRYLWDESTLSWQPA